MNLIIDFCQEKQRAKQEAQRAEQERQRAEKLLEDMRTIERLRAKLWELGIDPDTL